MSEFIFSGKNNIKTDLRYKYYYDELRSILKLTNGEIFMLALVIGYNEGRKSKIIDNKGAEFRPSYLKNEERSIIYAISYKEYGDEFINRFNEKDFQNKLQDTLIEYSNTGMELLIGKVLKDNLVDGKFISNYHDYDIDVIKYVYDQLNSVPF